MMNPLPNVSKAYALIVSDESQRHTSEMHTGGNMIEATTLYAGRGNYGSRNGRIDGDNSEYGKGNYNNKKKINQNLLSDHCKFHGHTKDICFKLVGYPEDQKFKNKTGNNNEPRFTNSRGTNHHKGMANNVQLDKVDDGLRSKKTAQNSYEAQGSSDFIMFELTCKLLP